MVPQLFEISSDKGLLKGTLHYIEKLYWAHTQALLFTEGGSVQTLIGPGHLFVDGERSAAHDIRPHLKKVILATLAEAPEEMDLLEAFAEIRRWSC